MNVGLVLSREEVQDVLQALIITLNQDNLTEDYRTSLKKLKKGLKEDYNNLCCFDEVFEEVNK